MVNLTTVLLALWLLTACAGASVPTETPTPLVTLSPSPTRAQPVATSTATATVAEVRWDVYHADPQHLWNRLFRHFYERTSREGRSYGRDTLDPLLWEETQYLLEGASHGQAIRLLDEFLSTSGEDLITAPLRRALFQRDLWAVFDWLAFRSDDHPTERRALQQRITQVMRRVVLTEAEILALPDTYHAAVLSRAFPTNYQQQNATTPFLPPDLLSPTGGWVCVGRDGGPMGIIHVGAFPFFGRSTFLVFIRVPSGREATVYFLHQVQDALLRHQPFPDVTSGTEVALVRRMLLIDQWGQLTPSPLIESVQMRHLNLYPASVPDQIPFEFTLSRDRLFAGQTGGLRALDRGDREFALFMTHGIDWFEFQSVQTEDGRIATLLTCNTCHTGVGFGMRGAQGILSLSRERFPLPDAQSLSLTETTPEREAQATVDWKMAQLSWKTLEALWGTP